MASYTDSYTNSITLASHIGNKPYATARITKIKCTVDYDANNPWACKVETTGYMAITKLDANLLGGTKGHLEVASIDPFFTKKHTWTAQAGRINGIDTSDTNFTDTKTITDIRNYLPSGIMRDAHTWFYITRRSSVSLTKNSGDWTVIESGQKQIPLLMPRVCGGNSANWRGSSSRNSSYAYRSVYVSANYSGITVGNVSHTVTFKVGGKTIGSQSNQSSGTIGGNYYVSSAGNVSWSIECAGVTIASGTWYFQDPPPSKPTMGSVNNTTSQSINTTQAKTISGNWYRGDVGWPQGTVTYNWECYYNGSCIKSGETTGTSTSFTYNIPSQNSGGDVYFRVRAKQNSNSLGYTGWMESGRATLFWAYNEPAKVAGVSINPNRFQLFYGNRTAITTSATMRINGWGDRPGTRNVEFRMINATKGQHVSWYGRNNTGETGNFTQALTATIPDANLNDVYEVYAHKRIGDTEYLAGSDARYPVTGTNNVKVGNITFYEVKGNISGTFSIDPNIVISGLSSSVNYQFTYDKQSSNKVDIYLEVFDIANNRVTKTFNFETGVNESKTISNRRSDLVLIEAQKAGSYEVRLKATITELLGNTTTHTLFTMQPENYDPPIPRIDINHLSKPLPTTKASSLLGKQDTNIAWDYNYSFNGVEIKSAEIEVSSKPFGKQVYSVPSSSSSSPYYGSYTRVSTGDFDLASTVSAKLRVYYSIYGDNRIWTVESNTLEVRITHTRYMFYYAHVDIGEKQMNQLRYLLENTDSVLKKIHIDD